MLILILKELIKKYYNNPKYRYLGIIRIFEVIGRY